MATKASGVNQNKQENEKYIGSVKFFKQLITVIVTLVILGLVGLVIYLLWNPKENLGDPGVLILDGPEEGDGRGILVTPDNVEDIRNRPAPTDTYLNTQMTAEWDFAAWDVPSDNAMVGNPENNTRIIYFDVNLDLGEESDELGELLYSSPYIPIGAKMTDFALESPLPKGEHSAIVTYFLVDDDFDVITDVAVGIVITVHN